MSAAVWSPRDRAFKKIQRPPRCCRRTGRSYADRSEASAMEDEQVVRRLEFAGGDMFEKVPDGDAFILKHIIHD